MDEKKLEEMKETMDKIQESMYLTLEKRDKIAEKEVALREETRIVMVEEGKEEIENLKADKKEFDEMTVNSLVSTKKDILLAKKDLQEEYQKELLEMAAKKKKIEELIERKQEQAYKEGNDKLGTFKLYGMKELDKVNNKLAELTNQQKERLNDLNEWEKKIDNFAVELDATEQLKAVTVEQAEAERQEKREAERQEKEKLAKEEAKEKQKEAIGEKAHEKYGANKQEAANRYARVYGGKYEEQDGATDKKTTDYDIIVDKKGANIGFGDNEYNVEISEIQEMMDLSKDDKKAFLEKVAVLAGYTEGQSENLEELYAKFEEMGQISKAKENLEKIDPTIVALAEKVCYSKGIDAGDNSGKEAAKDMITRYLQAFSKNQKAEALHIRYDLNSLSKRTTLLNRIKKQFFSLSDKSQIAQKAEVAKELGIAYTNGEFKPNFFDKLLARFESRGKGKEYLIEDGKEKEQQGKDEQDIETDNVQEQVKNNVKEMMNKGKTSEPVQEAENGGFKENVKDQEAAEKVVEVGIKAGNNLKMKNIKDQIEKLEKLEADGKLDARGKGRLEHWRANYNLLEKEQNKENRTYTDEDIDKLHEYLVNENKGSNNKENEQQQSDGAR